MTFLFTFVLLTSNSIISWNDVETFIYLIVTWILQDYEKIRSKYYNTVDFSRLNRELERPFFELFKNCGFRKLDPKNLQDSSNSQEFDKNSAARNLHLIIEDIFLSRNKNINEKNKDSIAISMLQSLNEFERNFSTFILEQIRNKEPSVPTYEKAASDLLSSIIQPHINSLYKHISNKNTLPKVNLDILNFNYSLNQTNISKIKSNQSTILDLKINSFTNIHGVASDNTKNVGNYNWPAPIFGVDSHDILGSNNISFDDPRIIFTKSFRLLDNHINDIRKSNFQDKVNVITFFGHSLSHADYSYFESIFDKYQIFNSNVKLEFYYYPGNTKGKTKLEAQVESKRQERKIMKNVVELLISYGETAANVHGENIVNKLMLEQRLSVLPYPKLYLEEE